MDPLWVSMDLLRISMAPTTSPWLDLGPPGQIWVQSVGFRINPSPSPTRHDMRQCGFGLLLLLSWPYLMSSWSLRPQQQPKSAPKLDVSLSVPNLMFYWCPAQDSGSLSGGRFSWDSKGVPQDFNRFPSDFNRFPTDFNGFLGSSMDFKGFP